jgi:hypothetical protein
VTSGLPAGRRATLPFAAAATIAAAAAGAALGTLLGGSDADAVREQPRVGLMSGAARLPLPGGWEPLGRPSLLPGLGGATAVRGPDGEAAVDIRPPEDPSLLPAALVAAAGGKPTPAEVELSGRAAWGYELPAAAPQRRLLALTLPTTAGVVTVACEAAADELSDAARRCGDALRGLQLNGARALPPTPETAVAIALPATIETLNRRRRTWRRALAATRSPAARHTAARRLANAYSAAARRLRPLAAGEALRLPAALTALARHHRKLATAGLFRNAAAARRAGAAIEAGERELRPLLRALSRPQPTARSAG